MLLQGAGGAASVRPMVVPKRGINLPGNRYDRCVPEGAVPSRRSGMGRGVKQAENARPQAEKQS